MLAKPLPSTERLRELFIYNEKTGILTRRITVNNCKAKKGDVAGWGKRYLQVEIDEKKYLVHRVIWKMVTGEEPNLIDHWDLDKLNNRWVNLRDGTKTQNQGNRTARKDNALGHKGIHWDDERKKFVAQLGRSGERWMRRFDSLDEAKAAHLSKSVEWYGPYARVA